MDSQHRPVNYNQIFFFSFKIWIKMSLWVLGRQPLDSLAAPGWSPWLDPGPDPFPHHAWGCPWPLLPPLALPLCSGAGHHGWGHGQCQGHLWPWRSSCCRLTDMRKIHRHGRPTVCLGLHPCQCRWSFKVSHLLFGVLGSSQRAEGIRRVDTQKP